MDRKALGAIAIGIIILMGVVVLNVAFFGGIDNAVARAYEQELQNIDAARLEVDRNGALIDAAMKRDPALRGLGEQELWVDQVTRARTQLSEIDEKLAQQGRKLLDNDKREDTPELGILVSEAQTQREEVLFALQRTAERARRLDDFLQKRESFLQQARTDAQAIRETSLAQVHELCAQAQEDWPQKKQDIDARLAALTSIPERELPLLMKGIEATEGKHISDIDPAQLFADIQQVHAHRVQLEEGLQSLPQLLDQLYVSYDKILIDMEIREGAMVEFFHHYQVLKVGRDDQPLESKQWLKVDESTFKARQKQLGMTIESKPKGLYDSEATRVAAPAGYNYVGNEHYGRWENRNSGGRFWVWYGQYAFMRDIFWGRNYNYYPVSYSDYDGYRRSRTSGRAYYGPSEQGRTRYGSEGSFAKSRYSSSKYVTNSGFKSSQYVKSGGNYRGSRFSSGGANRARSSSFLRGSRSRGGSRSFGK